MQFLEHIKKMGLSSPQMQAMALGYALYQDNKDDKDFILMLEKEQQLIRMHHTLVDTLGYAKKLQTTIDNETMQEAQKSKLRAIRQHFLTVVQTITPDLQDLQDEVNALAKIYNYQPYNYVKTNIQTQK